MVSLEWWSCPGWPPAVDGRSEPDHLRTVVRYGAARIATCVLRYTCRVVWTVITVPCGALHVAFDWARSEKPISVVIETQETATGRSRPRPGVGAPSKCERYSHA